MTPVDGGIALARSYFKQLVAPTIRRHLPEMRYAAARVGSGSEVLGLDDEMSRDHDWGLRLQLFVSDSDVAQLRSTLEHHLPAEFAGHPLRFGFSADPAVRLRIDVDSVDALITQHLGFDPRRQASALDWLSLSGQAVLEICAGEVFRDDVGELTSLRAALSWYPEDVWRYVIACDCSPSGGALFSPGSRFPPRSRPPCARRSRPTAGKNGPPASPMLWMRWPIIRDGSAYRPRHP